MSSTPLTITSTDTINPLTIKNSSSVEVCSINNNGVITSGGNIVLTTTYNPYHCAGKVGATGNVLNNSGRVGFSITKTVAGTYQIVYNSTYSGGGGGGQIINATVN